MLNPRHVCGHVGPRAHAIAQLQLLGHIAELPYQHRERGVLGCDLHDRLLLIQIEKNVRFQNVFCCVQGLEVYDLTPIVHCTP